LVACGSFSQNMLFVSAIFVACAIKNDWKSKKRHSFQPEAVVFMRFFEVVLPQ